MIKLPEEIDIDKLYEKSKEGISIVDKYLEKGHVEPCGEDNCAIMGEGFSFKFYGKEGDTVHFDYITHDESFRVDVEITRLLNMLNGYGYYSMDKELTWTGIYTVTIHNYDMENSGYISVFLIVYEQ